MFYTKIWAATQPLVVGYLFIFTRYVMEYWSLRRSTKSGKKKVVAVGDSWVGAHGTREFEISGSISQKNGVTMCRFCANNMCILCGYVWIAWFQDVIKSVGWIWLEILALRSQMVGYLRETFYTLWRTCNRLVQKKRKTNDLRKRVTIYCWLLWRPVVGGDAFSPLAPFLGPQQKTG